MDKFFLHLDMDAFFASVEQAATPKYRGRPLIVGSRGRKYQTVVAACSYEAKKFGVESGMPTAAAFRLCPYAEFVSADTAKYLYTSDEIYNLLKNYPCPVERVSIDEFFLEVSHLDLPRAAKIALEIKQKIREKFHITGSIGIAASKLLAKMAAKSQKPDGLVILKKEAVAEFLKDRPVEKIPGVGPQMKKNLNGMGIFTCGQLAQINPEVLTTRFGKIGFWLSQVSQGQDSPLGSYWSANDLSPKSIGHSYTLEREIYELSHLEAWLLLLAEMVGYRLRQEKLLAEVIHFYVEERRGFFSRQKKFFAGTDDASEIFQRAFSIFKSFRLKNFAVRALGVSAARLGRAAQLDLFENHSRRRRLLAAVDSLNEKFGEWSVYPAALKKIKM